MEGKPEPEEEEKKEKPIMEEEAATTLQLQLQQQLMDMGFAQSLASKALSATSSSPTLHSAAEWILNHQNPHLSPSPPPPISTTSTPPVQHSLDRYFSSSSRPKRPPPPSPTKPQQVLDPNKKRPKSEPTPTPTTTTTTFVSEPLSERMRPRTIDEVVGQDHLLGPNSILRSALSRRLLPSLILWGPPGTGKTSIARAIAASASPSYRFVSLSAVSSGVKEVREVLDEASKKLKNKNHRTVLFVDEVHRFNRTQLDSFLPAIEDGTIVFVGATTENPSFHLTTPLLSRCRVLSLPPLQPSHIAALLHAAVNDKERGLALALGTAAPISFDGKAVEFLSLHCDGDARVALNSLEVAATLAMDHRTPGVSDIAITLDDVKESLQRKHLAYDRAGEEHYNLISALHKSMRGSDVDAAIYWLARMLEGGEQPLYIARRLVRFASEDVGLADPSAMVQAVACYQACHFLGLPECDANLAQCVAYLALAPKSVALYRAIEAAKKLVRDSGGGNEGVPLHIRNAPTKLMKEFGYGKGYIYPPDHPDAPPQSFLPPSLQDHKFLDWPP